MKKLMIIVCMLALSSTLFAKQQSFAFNVGVNYQALWLQYFLPNFEVDARLDGTIASVGICKVQTLKQMGIATPYYGAGLFLAQPADAQILGVIGIEALPIKNIGGAIEYTILGTAFDNLVPSLTFYLRWYFKIGK